MDIHSLLRLMHITAFAAWFGSVFASFYVLRSLEPGLTGEEQAAKNNFSFLMRYIALETKVADVAFIVVLASGVLLAWFFHGWTAWLGIKILLIVLQVALTMGYIKKAIHPLRYPCSQESYTAWYRLFAISFTMFTLVIGVSFFFL